MSIPSKNPYRTLVCGVNEMLPLENADFLHVNFDNAATTPPLNCVLKDILDFSPWYSSIHRGVGYKSKYSSDIYDNSRRIVSGFIGASPEKDSIIYVKNTTEAINKLASRLADIYPNSTVLSTCMEHHSNDLPWRNKFTVDFVQIDDRGMLSLEDLEEKLISYDGKVKLVTVTGASNTTGYINPIHKIAKLAHAYGAKILVDGAQLIPHDKFNMKPSTDPEHIDFVAFSAHKMYAPFGIGVLVAPKEVFCCGNPDHKGGGTVQLVTDDYALWSLPPDKDEAGTPNIMGVVALTSAIEMLESIGMKNLAHYEMFLFNYLLSKIEYLDDIEIYTSLDKSIPRVSILPFNIKGIPHSTLAKALCLDWHISVRSGCFCAQPYMQKILNVTSDEIYSYTDQNLLPTHGVVRISIGMYNTTSEIDYLIKALKYISCNKDYYVSKYPLEPICIDCPKIYDIKHRFL